MHICHRCLYIYVMGNIKSFSLCCWRRSCFLSTDLKTVSFIGNKEGKSQRLTLISFPSGNLSFVCKSGKRFTGKGEEMRSCSHLPHSVLLQQNFSVKLWEGWYRWWTLKKIIMLCSWGIWEILHTSLDIPSLLEHLLVPGGSLLPFKCKGCGFMKQMNIFFIFTLWSRPTPAAASGLCRLPFWIWPISGTGYCNNHPCMLWGMFLFLIYLFTEQISTV